MVISYLVKELPGAVVGLAVGVFIPGVLRQAKALFVKESKVAVTAAEKVASTGAADVKKIL